jgi:hypothetical protein
MGGVGEEHDGVRKRTEGREEARDRGVGRSVLGPVWRLE